MKMNQDLFKKFIEAVKAEKIEGCEVAFYGRAFVLVDKIVTVLRENGKWEMDAATPELLDYLCAHLRRWMTDQKVPWNLQNDQLIVHCGTPAVFLYGRDEGLYGASELDAHINATLWVLEQQEKK